MFYTYLWLREDGTPYYAGKGKGTRAYRKHRVGKCPTDRILMQSWNNEAEAFEAEKFLIDFYGREDLGTGCLLNLTNGGENPPSPLGKKRTSEEIKKSADSRRGSWHHTEEAKKLMSKQRQGRTPWNKGLKTGERAPFSEETKHKMSLAQLGKTPSKETRMKIKLTLKSSGFCPSNIARDLASMKRWGTHVREKRST